MVTSNYFTTYGLKGLGRLILDKVVSTIFFKNIRIIRRPYYIRGKRNVDFGKNLTTGVGLRIDAFSSDQNAKTLMFGDNVELNDYVHIGAIQSVKIGNNVLIGSKVFISDHNHGSYGSKGIHNNPNINPRDRKLYFAPVVIEDNVWIGEFVSILPGVKIGKGSIIGTMSVVTKDIPPFSIAIGSPARVIKTFDFNTQKWIYIN